MNCNIGSWLWTNFWHYISAQTFLLILSLKKNISVSGSPGCLSSGKREEFDPDGNQGLQQERPEGPHCLLDSGQKGHGMLENSFWNV